MNDGTIILSELNNDAEQVSASLLLNGTLIDANNLHDFEIDSD